MRNDQYGRWAVGDGYGGGVRYGTYETYCKDPKKWSEFEPCERPEPVKKDIKEKKVKDLTISELKELLRELNKERED